MSTRQEVVACYRALLGRDPEGDEVFSTRANETLEETLRSLLNSEEFRSRHSLDGATAYHTQRSVHPGADILRQAAKGSEK